MKKVLDSGKFWEWVQGIATVGWLVQFPVVLLWRHDLQDSVPYLIIISIAAAALGQLAAWQAARSERKLDKLIRQLL